MRKNRKKSLVALLIFGTAIFLGAYLMNITLLDDQGMQESEIATSSGQTGVQQLPWWKQWQRIYLTSVRGCKQGSTTRKKQLSLGNQATHDNTRANSLVARSRQCFM